jgi:hypothetical protein
MPILASDASLFGLICSVTVTSPKIYLRQSARKSRIIYSSFLTGDSFNIRQ